MRAYDSARSEMTSVDSPSSRGKLHGLEDLQVEVDFHGFEEVLDRRSWVEDPLEGVFVTTV